MKYLRSHVYLCLLCIGVVSCTSTPPTGPFYFPITVLAGVADLTVSIGGEMQTDTHYDPETFAENARALNKMLNREKIQFYPQKETPSEYDYSTKISLQTRRNSTEITDQPSNDGGKISSSKLQKGESFSMLVPMQKEVTVVAENKGSEELRFVCTGKQFVLQQGEIVILHFR